MLHISRNTSKHNKFIFCQQLGHTTCVHFLNLLDKYLRFSKTLNKLNMLSMTTHEFVCLHMCFIMITRYNIRPMPIKVRNVSYLKPRLCNRDNGFILEFYEKRYTNRTRVQFWYSPLLIIIRHILKLKTTSADFFVLTFI